IPPNVIEHAHPPLRSRWTRSTDHQAASSLTGPACRPVVRSTGTQQSALETGPVSKVWITNALRGLTATLERLRVDRQLEEALTHGPDPLHLATVFGIDEKTAIRYASTARQLLQSTLECDTPD
ncbi:MAG: hypothetical protein ACRDRU_22045, partial [Pseudonocardiaceae bacterium]